MKEKLAKLIDVKSIMTLLVTVVFCVLALTGVIAADQFLTIFTVIVGFYFGTQSQKKAEAATTAASTEAPLVIPAASDIAPVSETVTEAQYAEVHPGDAN